MRSPVSTVSTVSLLSIFCVLGWSTTAWAGDFYLDPINGSIDGDGSEANPWGSIQEVIDAGLIESQSWDGAMMVPLNPGAPVKAGDTLWLRSGYHGELSITGYHNTEMVTIAAAPGETPELSSVLLRAVSQWTVQGLTISPEFAPQYSNAGIVDILVSEAQGPMQDVVFEGCTIYSIADITPWSASDWDSLAASGMRVDGTRITVRDNLLSNVNFGISVSATESLIDHNTIDSFSGDGLRGLGDYTTFQYNTVKNCYDVNDNHDDGFQSWSLGPGGVGTGAVTGIVLRGNTIINYEDPDQPLRGPLQGIGLFDGMFVDWVVENNVIITDHWHGITFVGAENARIVNNTVLDPNAETPGPPWIQIVAHKDGTPPTNNLVRNNLATDFASAVDGVTEDNNMVIDDPAALFVDVANYDLHLLETAPAVDAGSADLAPELDRDQWPRPSGAGVDIGAYEWHLPDPGGDGDGDPGGDGDGDDPGGDGDGDDPGGDADTGESDSAASTDETGGDSGGQTGADEGCSCRAGEDSPPWLWLLGLGLVAGISRPNRRDAV